MKNYYRHDAGLIFMCMLNKYMVVLVDDYLIWSSSPTPKQYDTCMS